MTAASRTRWVTFDCFGTLVDWRAGFGSILTPLVGANARAMWNAYREFERTVEAERPHRLYKDVLAAGLAAAAAHVGVSWPDRESDALTRAWGSIPLFPDVEGMLDDLRSMGFRLAVLTNCDDDLFQQTHRGFRVPFDLVVTAERVRDYKPSLSHFRYFDRVSGVGVGDWVHVACSWYHDMAPARTLGIKRIWLDRERTGEDPSVASLQVRSAVEVAEAVARLCPRVAAERTATGAPHVLGSGV